MLIYVKETWFWDLYMDFFSILVRYTLSVNHFATHNKILGKFIWSVLAEFLNFLEEAITSSYWRYECTSIHMSILKLSELPWWRFEDPRKKHIICICCRFITFWKRFCLPGPPCFHCGNCWQLPNLSRFLLPFESYGKLAARCKNRLHRERQKQFTYLNSDEIVSRDLHGLDSN